MAQTESNRAAQDKQSFPSFADWMRPQAWTRLGQLGQVGVVGEQWAKQAEEQLGRFGAALEELGKTEKVALDQAHGMVQELSRLAMASLDYSARLGAEWRRGAVDAGRRGLDLMRPKA